MARENTEDLLKELEELNKVQDSDYRRLSSAFKDLSEKEKPTYSHLDEFPPRIRRWALVNGKSLTEAEDRWYGFCQAIHHTLDTGKLPDDILEHCHTFQLSQEKREFLCTKNAQYAFRARNCFRQTLAIYYL